MTQEELKEYILSKITLNKEYWRPKVEALFKEDHNVTREKLLAFFEEWIMVLRREYEGFRKEYDKKRYGERGVEDVPIEVRLSDIETSLFDKARRQQGLIPLEEVVFAIEEIEMAFDEAGFE